MLRHWKATTILLVLIAVMCFAARVQRAKLARAKFGEGFAGVTVGMSADEVERRLGMPPREQRMILGRVDSPTQFVFNDNPLPADRDSYRQFDFRQWTTPQLNAILVFDRGGRVLCKYATAEEHRWPADLSALLDIF